MRAPTITSVTRWLLVVVGCAVLATAQPMSAASPDAPAGAPAADTIIYPKNSADRPAGPTAPASASASSDFGRSLGIVAAFLLAGAGVWLLVQRRNAGPLASRTNRKLQVDETRTLGNRQYLIVASYDGRKFLIGVTPGQIQMLSSLDDGAKQEKLP